MAALRSLLPCPPTRPPTAAPTRLGTGPPSGRDRPAHPKGNLSRSTIPTAFVAGHQRGTGLCPSTAATPAQRRLRAFPAARPLPFHLGPLLFSLPRSPFFSSAALHRAAVPRLVFQLGVRGFVRPGKGHGVQKLLGFPSPTGGTDPAVVQQTLPLAPPAAPAGLAAAQRHFHNTSRATAARSRRATGTRKVHEGRFLLFEAASCPPERCPQGSTCSHSRVPFNPRTSRSSAAPLPAGVTRDGRVRSHEQIFVQINGVKNHLVVSLTPGTRNTRR